MRIRHIEAGQQCLPCEHRVSAEPLHWLPLVRGAFGRARSGFAIWGRAALQGCRQSGGLVNRPFGVQLASLQRPAHQVRLLAQCTQSIR